MRRVIVILILDVTAFLALFIAGVLLQAWLQTPFWLTGVFLMPPFAYAWWRGVASHLRLPNVIVPLALLTGGWFLIDLFGIRGRPWGKLATGILTFAILQLGIIPGQSTVEHREFSARKPASTHGFVVKNKCSDSNTLENKASNARLPWGSFPC